MVSLVSFPLYEGILMANFMSRGQQSLWTYYAYLLIVSYNIVMIAIHNFEMIIQLRQIIDRSCCFEVADSFERRVELS